jgi:hypothetical protein
MVDCDSDTAVCILACVLVLSQNTAYLLSRRLFLLSTDWHLRHLLVPETFVSLLSSKFKFDIPLSLQLFEQDLVCSHDSAPVNYSVLPPAATNGLDQVDVPPNLGTYSPCLALLVQAGLVHL